MSNPDDQRRAEAQRRETSERQNRAADPKASAWVSANAGTGKTYVLTARVLRLMLAGTRPERLLCLTYTKAAAAEMSDRVFKRLAGWVTADEPKLRKELKGLLGQKPTEAEMTLARDLFTAAIETPGGLKVQTIHAFCERLLQRFPLEAGVPPGFQILDDETRDSLIAEATEATLAEATADTEGLLGQALARTIAWAHDDSFDEVLRQALGRRDWIDVARRIEYGSKRHGEDDLAAAERLYRSGLDLERDDTREALEAALAGVLPESVMRRARDVLAGGTTTDASRAQELSAATAAGNHRTQISALAGFFLTGKGEPRKSLMTAKLKKAEPDLDDRLVSAQAEFARLMDRRGRMVVHEATMALLRLASAVMQRFIDLKHQRAALDFDDLIRAAGSLLRKGEDAQWVLYKLDGGLDHILVDEAQDTSLTQWRVVEALAREFFAGEGARESETGAARTVFAVGDEKQSIYGFQGAAPKMFADMGALFERMTAPSGHDFQRIPLTLSFRTVAPILDSVDRIFADATRARGLTYTGEVQRHMADRLGVAGLVEIWDTEKPDDTEPSPAFQPLEETAASSPSSRLADQIADTIRGWLDSGEQLASVNRPVTPGDILILVRKRRPFADLMVSALKARRIPVAGADRLRLGDQLAVVDVMALCDFLLLPEDDLALAGVLKSPMFGLDDDDLLVLAPKRRGSLWSALLAAVREGRGERFAEAAERLRFWRTRSDLVPPYEFLAEVLLHGGMRKRLLARLGPEAADPLDELMALALTYDDQAAPSLQGFMDWLRSSEREIKRDMELSRDEVRVMTVHGSKGLEAPIVFMPDTCSPATSTRPVGILAFPGMPRPDPEPEPFVWPVKGSSAIEAISAARRAVRDRDSEEHNRLLYVALTRARDRLYVAGFEGTKGRAPDCWYSNIEAGLADVLDEATDAAGNRIRRVASQQTADIEDEKESEADHSFDAVPLPEWATREAPREAGLSFPLAPSRLAPLETDAEGDPVEPKPAMAAPSLAEAPPAPSPRVLAGEHRFLRGTITHALLQHLPSFPLADREAAAQRFVEIRGRPLRPAVRNGIVGETLAVLSDPAFAAVFGPDSRAEVPIAARIPNPAGEGEPLHLAGQIDRLVATAEEVLIVDFKTNRPPPTDPAEVADAYVLQLAAYRLAVAQVFPERRIRAALLWTDGPRLMEMPADRLDAAAMQLFKLKPANLDA